MDSSAISGAVGELVYSEKFAEERASMAKSKAARARGSLELGGDRKPITFDAIFRAGTPREIFGTELSRFQSRGMPDGGTGIELVIKGQDFGREFSDFTIHLCGIAIEPPPRNDDGRISIPGWFLRFDEIQDWEGDAQIYLRRIYCRGTRAYIKESWYRLTEWITTIVDIEDIPPRSRFKEISRLAKGFAMRFSSELNRQGRPTGPAFDTDKQMFSDKLKTAYTFLQELEPSKRLARIDVAMQMDYSLSTFKRRLKAFGIPWPPKFE
jgi:hypothetical protein